MSNDDDYMRISVLDTHPGDGEHMKDKSEEITNPEENQSFDDNVNDDNLKKK